MTSKLANFAARLRDRILLEGRISRRLELETLNKDGDSNNSSLRNDEAFNSLALELFALQYTHNAAYRRICEALQAGPVKVAHWWQIPAVPTAAFKERELTCLAPARRTHVFHSSGTTEQRLSRHFHNAESLAVYEEASLTWFRFHFPQGGRLVILTPPPVKAPQSSLVHMLDGVRRDSGEPATAFTGRIADDGGWKLDLESTTRALTISCTDATPVLLLGTAFSFVHLLDFIAEQDLRFQLPSGSRVMETGGYKGRSRSLPKSELHALITERFGLAPSEIVCEYGMSELSSQAYDRVTSDRWPVTRSYGRESCHLPFVPRQFHFPPWARVQIISPETGRETAGGETGLIRVFDLANVFSVMAIQTEDLGIRRGDGFELIGRAALADPRGCSLMAV